MHKWSVLLLPLLTIILFVSLKKITGSVSCGKRIPVEMTRAANVIYTMMNPNQLSRSAFSVAFEDGKPSQFVSYIFSDMGRAEWPDITDSPDYMVDQKYKPALDVSIVPLSVDLNKGKQIVVTYNDLKNVVIVLGFMDPYQKPVLKKEWKLPKVIPVPGVEEMYRANLEMGLSVQAF